MPCSQCGKQCHCRGGHLVQNPHPTPPEAPNFSDPPLPLANFRFWSGNWAPNAPRVWRTAWGKAYILFTPCVTGDGLDMDMDMDSVTSNAENLVDTSNMHEKHEQFFLKKIIPQRTYVGVHPPPPRLGPTPGTHPPDPLKVLHHRPVSTIERAGGQVAVAASRSCLSPGQPEAMCAWAQLAAILHPSTWEVARSRAFCAEGRLSTARPRDGICDGLVHASTWAEGQSVRRSRAWPCGLPHSPLSPPPLHVPHVDGPGHDS